MFKISSYITYFKTFACVALALLYFIPFAVAASNTPLYITPNTIISSAEKIVVVHSQNKTRATTIKDNSLKPKSIKIPSASHPPTKSFLYITPNTIISNAEKIVTVHSQNKTRATTVKDNSFKHVFIKPKTVVHNLHFIKELHTDQTKISLNSTRKAKPTKNRKAKDLKTKKPVIQPVNPSTPFNLLFKKGSCCCTLSPNPIKLDFPSVILAYTVKHNLSKRYQILYYNRHLPVAQQLHALYSFSLPPPHFLFA